MMPMMSEEQYRKGDVWLPPNLKIKIPAFQETDPTTGDELADDYAAIQRTQNAEFFGDFLQEALTNGLSIRSIAEFYANRTIANDDEPLPIVRQRGRHDNTDPSEETLESMQQRLQHRRQEKKKHREMSDRVPNKPQGEFDKTHFEPLPINMGPRKTQSLNFLSVVVKNTADIDHRADHKRLSAFSVDWENCASDFRESGAYFRKWYKKRLPPQTKGTKVSEMDPRDLENALKIEEMAMEGKVAGVVDENGVVYLNGYITPWTTRDYDHDTVVKIIKDGWVDLTEDDDEDGELMADVEDAAEHNGEGTSAITLDDRYDALPEEARYIMTQYLPATCFLRNYTTRNPSRNKVDGSDDSVKDEQSDQSTDNEAPPPALKKTKSTRKKLDDLATTKIAKISPKKARKRRITEDSEEDSDDDDDDDVGKMILESSDEVSSEDFEDSEGSGDEDMSNYFLNQRAGPPEEQEEEEEAPEASSGVPEEPEEPEKQRERPSGFSIDSILGSK
ncbi:Protein CBG29114 [Caenorhabditis briggsae]|uniref:Protein CBG29114 n=1 Tax=Caenorhabditis briggsae TaxID=6238 RepID=H8WH71_CAEBR|nr:Protein CBG29114 [Caenorhabditis briggsae]CCG58601.1 Protein CBG29114 [Caenorhabditis briggsae]